MGNYDDWPDWLDPVAVGFALGAVFTWVIIWGLGA